MENRSLRKVKVQNSISQSPLSMKQKNSERIGRQNYGSFTVVNNFLISSNISQLPCWEVYFLTSRHKLISLTLDGQNLLINTVVFLSLHHSFYIKSLRARKIVEGGLVLLSCSSVISLYQLQRSSIEVCCTQCKMQFFSYPIAFECNGALLFGNLQQQADGSPLCRSFPWQQISGVPFPSTSSVDCRSFF